MLTPTPTTELPDWAEVGAQAGYMTRALHTDNTAGLATIVRITPTQVITERGTITERWSRRKMMHDPRTGEVEIAQHSAGGAYDPDDILMSPRSARFRAAYSLTRLTGAQGRLEAALRASRDARRYLSRPRMTEAEITSSYGDVAAAAEAVAEAARAVMVARNALDEQ